MVRTSKKFGLLGLVLVSMIFQISTVVETFAGTTGKISGMVTDAETKKPLPGVVFSIEGSTMSAVSHSDGAYFFLNVAPGIYRVSASLMGYISLTQKNVRVSVDRTTRLTFELRTRMLDVEDNISSSALRLVVTADVTASQAVYDREQIGKLPAATVLEALAFEPGVVLENREAFRFRDGNPSESRFLVDGFERVDRLNSRAYTILNSALISEIQLLTGGFNAEYGNASSGVINVVTQERLEKISGTIDYNIAPAGKKHFGPGMYDAEQYGQHLYSSMEPVADAEGNPLWMGWNSRTEVLNSGDGFLGKTDWTPEELYEVWKSQTEGVEYGDTPEHNLTLGLGVPLDFLAKIGIKEATLFGGYRLSRHQPVFPSVTENYLNHTGDLKLTFKPAKSLKIILTGMAGKTRTAAGSNNWYPNRMQLPLIHEGTDLVTDAVGTYKYAVDSQGVLDMWNYQFGAKITHAITAATNYEIRYTYFQTESEIGPAESRLQQMDELANMGRTWVGDLPAGLTEFPDYPFTTDLTGRYQLYGGSILRDTSSVVTNTINLDVTSQITQQHLLKFGVAAEMSELSRAYQRVFEDGDGLNEYNAFEESPRRYAAFVQDKIEYGELVANIGLRFDYFDANTQRWSPDEDDPFSSFFATGGTAIYANPAEVPATDSKVYWHLSPRIGLAHPLGQHLKFFFNYGTYYSEPAAVYRFGSFSRFGNFGDDDGIIRWMGNPDLKPPKTSTYEVGVEASLFRSYLLHTVFYQKNSSDQIGELRVSGQTGSLAFGEYSSYIRGGAIGYSIPKNNGFQDTRGIEIKFSKKHGKYLSGWLFMDYPIAVSGNYGLQILRQDPQQGAVIYTAAHESAADRPNYKANIDLYTPQEWGRWLGDWRLSVIETYLSGKETTWNPENLPAPETGTRYRWKNYDITDFRLTKMFRLADRRVHIYMDVNNLFNNKFLNRAAFNVSEWDTYLRQVVDDENGLGNAIGDVYDADGNNVFTEDWTDAAQNQRAPIAPFKDFAMFLNPRSFLLVSGWNFNVNGNQKQDSVVVLFPKLEEKNMKRIRYSAGIAMLLFLLLSAVVMAGTSENYLRIGRLWMGCEFDGAEGGNSQAAWPGGYRNPNFESTGDLWNGTIQTLGTVAGCRNWLAPNGTTYDYWTSGMYQTYHAEYLPYWTDWTDKTQLFPVGQKEYMRWAPPEVIVNGTPVLADAGENYLVTHSNAVIDPTLVTERMIESEWDYSMGMTYVRRAYAYSTPNHQDYILWDVTLKNQGRMNETPAGAWTNQRITDFYWAQTGMPRNSQPGAEDEIGKFIQPFWDSHRDPRRFYLFYDGDNPRTAIRDWADPNDDARYPRLLSPAWIAGGAIRCDTGPTNSSDDPTQPTTTLIGQGGDFDLSQFPQSMMDQYQILFEGRLRDGHHWPLNTPQTTVVPEITRPSGYLSYGPWDFEPGDDVQLSFVWAAGGMDMETCIRLGSEAYRSNFQDQSVMDEIETAFNAGKDSLLNSLEHAYWNVNGEKGGRPKYDVPDAPRPPAKFEVTVDGPKILLNWSDESRITPDFDTGVVDFEGYRVYRARGRGGLYTKIYDGTDNLFEDMDVTPGTEYFYYLTAYDNGSQNWENPGVKLESGRFYCWTGWASKGVVPLTTGAAELDNIRVVPNPYSISGHNFAGEEDKIMFTGLPGQCIIKIYTSAGDFVKSLTHENGSAQEYWDLRTDYGQFIVSDVYIFTVESDLGDYAGKLVIIR